MHLRSIEIALLMGLIATGLPVGATAIAFRENSVIQDGTTISTTYQTGVVSIRKSQPDTNLEGAPTIVPGTTTGSAGIIRAVLSYDLALIPANATVTNATLTLFSSSLILKLTDTEELYNGRYIFQIVSDDPGGGGVSIPANQPTLTVGYKLPPTGITILIR